MRKEFKYLIYILATLFISMTFITGCSNTFQGMKQDMREDSDSDYDTDDEGTAVIEKTEVFYPSQSTPTSPPPLQTPAQ